MVQFLAVLMQTVQNNNIELAVFFNGALEQQRLSEWARHECSLRKNVNSVSIFSSVCVCVYRYLYMSLKLSTAMQD